jgi:hypothetical protein
MVKSYARRKIFSRQAHILNAFNLLEECADLNVCFLSYLTEAVEETKKEFDDQWMAGTAKVR